MAASVPLYRTRNTSELQVDMEHLGRMRASAREILALVRQTSDTIGETHKVLADLDRHFERTHYIAPLA